MLLAERESFADEARELYAQGVAAGKRALGPTVFEAQAGHFWHLRDTRPFMRALQGLAQTCESSDMLDEAIGHYQELIRLNPNDNQGVRYSLAACLLRTRRFDEVKRLLSRYDESFGHCCFLKALAAFATAGDTADSRRLLAEANRANPHVRKYLSGEAPLPEHPPDTYAFGTTDEAMIIALESLAAWEETEGAQDWLKQSLRKETGRDDRWKGIKKKPKKGRR